MEKLIVTRIKTLDEIISMLKKENEKGNDCFYDFLGHRLYSNNIEVDSAYREVYGMSRDEYRKNITEMYKNHLINLKGQLENEQKSKNEKIEELITMLGDRANDEQKEQIRKVLKNNDYGYRISLFQNDINLILEIIELSNKSDCDYKEIVRKFNDTYKNEYSKKLIVLEIIKILSSNYSKGLELYIILLNTGFPLPRRHSKLEFLELYYSFRNDNNLEQLLNSIMYKKEIYEEIIDEYDRSVTKLELEKYTRRKSNHI